MKKRTKPPALDLDQVLYEAGWYDMWHTHVDWRGDGNCNKKARRPFLRALFDLFAEIEKRVANWTKPCQTWLVIEESDSSQDAVYLHTANPNADSFPYEFEGVEWDSDVPKWLEDFVDRNRHETGRCVFKGTVTFWVRSRIHA